MPFEPPKGSLIEAMQTPLAPEPHVLAVYDSTTDEVAVCAGTFDHFAYPPAWTADGQRLYLSPPFEPKRIYVAGLEEQTLHPILFKRHAPIPMLDERFLRTG